MKNKPELIQMTNKGFHLIKAGTLSKTIMHLKSKGSDNHEKPNEHYNECMHISQNKQS